MTGFLEDQALRFMGLDDNDIKQLNDRIPDVMNLIRVLEAHMDQINRVMALSPIIMKLLAKQQELGK